MNDPRFPEKRVNLVEEETWKEHWDSGGKIMDYANDNACDEFHQMGARDFERYVDDLATYRTKGKKAPKKFSSEEIEWIAKRVKAGDIRVESVGYAIRDALTWMYEAAYLPQEGDVADAKDQAAENVLGNFSLNLDLWEPVLLLGQQRRGPKEWSPRKRLEEGDILRDLLKHVELEQEEGHYDRFLVFDFRSSQSAKDLLSRSTWAEVDLVYSLKIEFDALRNDYVIDFFSALKKIMEDIDINNRTDWQKSWKAVLSSGDARGAQKEMAAALKQMPAETETEEDDES